MAEEKQPTPHDELYAYMSAKDTDELVEIYQENDVEGRSKESLAVVRQILLERLGELPDKEVDEEDLPDEEEEFEFPNDKALYRLANSASQWSGWVLLVFVINFGLKLSGYFYSVIGVSFNTWNGTQLLGAGITILTQIETLLYGVFLYLLLQAVTEIIYLLMDIRDLFQVTETRGEASA